jgi:uncharacterized coiled-coil DUF342 family protein
MDFNELISLSASIVALISALGTIGSGFYFLGKMRAETTMIERENVDLKKQIDRLSEIVAKLSGDDGKTDFRLTDLERNTEAIRRTSSEMSEFRGEIRAQNATFKDSIDRITREIAALNRMMANIATEKFRFRLDE